MTNLETSTANSEAPAPRKPRIAIMGEFSVGKSTLANLLIGSNPLPVQVTATQLPPVWMSYGDDAAYREDLEGNVIPVDIAQLDRAPLADTAVIRIFLKSDILELCDLIDMPGISDPNMSAEVWQRVLHNADGVLWCTHATQAWRQSEAAVWKTMPPELFEKSFLLITRIDKLLTESDRQKVVKRVRRETQELFAGLFPISLSEALEGHNDRDLWTTSGAEAFTQCLVDLTHDLSQALRSSAPRQSAGTLRASESSDCRPNAPQTSATETTLASIPNDPKVRRLDIATNKNEPNAPNVMPARVKVASPAGPTTPRPDSSGSGAVGSRRPAGNRQDHIQLASNQEGL